MVLGQPLLAMGCVLVALVVIRPLISIQLQDVSDGRLLAAIFAGAAGLAVWAMIDRFLTCDVVWVTSNADTLQLMSQDSKALRRLAMQLAERSRP